MLIDDEVVEKLKAEGMYVRINIVNKYGVDYVEYYYLPNDEVYKYIYPDIPDVAREIVTTNIFPVVEV